MRNISIDIPRSALSCLTLMLTIACEPAAYEKGIPVETVIMKDKETADAFKNLTAEEIKEIKDLLKNKKLLYELFSNKKDIEDLIKLKPILEKITPEMVKTLIELAAIENNISKGDGYIVLNTSGKFELKNSLM